MPVTLDDPYHVENALAFAVGAFTAQAARRRCLATLSNRGLALFIRLATAEVLLRRTPETARATDYGRLSE